MAENLRDNLISLGHDASILEDGENVLIQNYQLPDGWNKSSCDVVLHVPPSELEPIHGVMIPQDVAPLEKITMVPILPNSQYLEDWKHLSFKLSPELQNENYVANHMDFVRSALSFQRRENVIQ